MSCHPLVNNKNPPPGPPPHSCLTMATVFERTYTLVVDFASLDGTVWPCTARPSVLIPNASLDEEAVKLLDRVDGVYADEVDLEDVETLRRLMNIPQFTGEQDQYAFFRGAPLPAGACITRVCHLMHRAP